MVEPLSKKFSAPNSQYQIGIRICVYGSMPHIPRDVIAEINRSNAVLLPQGKQICRHCRETKTLDEFHTQDAARGIRKPYCRTCCKERYYDKDSTRVRSKLWRKNNPERARAIYHKEKSKPHQKMKSAMKRRIKDYLKATQTAGQWRNLVSCTPQELQTHLESQFTSSMSWTNYGTFWHIDHIIPCAAFDWSRPGHIQWCWHRNNLRPLPALENEMKGDLLPSGENASQLRLSDPDRLNEIVGVELERLSITTIAEFDASLLTASRVTILDL